MFTGTVCCIREFMGRDGEGGRGAGEEVYGERWGGREGRCGGRERGRKGSGPNLVSSVPYSLT